MDENTIEFLTNLYPKYVINSKGEKKKFDEYNISKVLNKETGLDILISEKVAQEVVRQIIGLGCKEITTNHIRELVCLELTQRGMNKYRNLFARSINLENISFKLDEEFLSKYKDKQPKWGSLGYITYKRTYARIIEKENRKEEFCETVKRVVEGCYSIQKEHCIRLTLPWSDSKAQRSAQMMYDKIWNFKMSPPGRGMWMMGTEFIARHGSMALNNCGFASTDDINLKYSKAFEFVMDALMLGVGVGFDTKGAGKLTIMKPKDGYFDFQIPDSREGWVEALRLVLEAFFMGNQVPNLDFSIIRLKGVPIRGFGGIASGPEPLKEMLNDIKNILMDRIGDKITSVDIVDIMNHIGKCVVAGNVRRSAEIALGDPTDLDFVTCKQDQKKLYSHRWASNNSVFAVKGLDYSFIADQIKINGEPGILWLDNARAYSRMGDKPDYKDNNAAGVNPCITGDTLIAVADGRVTVPIKQLAEEGEDVPVYCKDEEGITQIRMMRNPRKTGIQKEIMEVLLDDGSIVRCTPNHKFLLTDLEMRPTEALKPGDSLMVMSKWVTTWDEIMNQHTSNKKTEYWMINDGNKNIFEHTFIYERLNNTKVPSGCVIHHKNFNGLDNSLDNLKQYLKEEHGDLHDISGDNNPMRKWYPNATNEEIERYHRRMSKATSGACNPRYSGYTNQQIYQEMVTYIKESNLPLTVTGWKTYAMSIGMIYNFTDYRGNLKNLIKKANFECGFDHPDNPTIMREYKRYIELLDKTDLELVFEEGIRVIKVCEICGSEFKVTYGKRERAFCSRQCANQYAATFAGRVTMKLGEQRHSKIIKDVCNLFKKFVIKKKYVPSGKEFTIFLKDNGINDLRTAGLSENYQKFLNHIIRKHYMKEVSVYKLRKQTYQKELANRLIDNGLTYNHKVVSIRSIGTKDVYNGTVDDFHNYGIILDEKSTLSGRRKLEIIFTANCGEQTLESFELCCLVETFPSRHKSYDEFQETLKYAYLYAKSVTLVNTHWQETNAVMLKNRRMGISQTGIIEAFLKVGRRQMLDWCDKGYKYLRKLDEQYSNWLCIPKSIKLTTVKPSGTISLLPGVSPGIHYPHSKYYIRRIRLSKNSDLVDIIREAGYKIEDDLYSKNSLVVEFPVVKEYFDRSKNDVSIWEQAENAAAYQKLWSDNQVSITITFKPEEAKEIKHVLECYEDKLKSVSFLPLTEHGYEQAPYEEITKEQYKEMISRITPIISLEETKDRSLGVVFCDSDKCELKY